MKYFRNIYDWYYNIEDRIDIILGDFNPKNNEKTQEIMNIISQENINMFPYTQVTSDNDVYFENTTKKTRSGYCAQYKKFWKPSIVCKDLIFVKNANIIEGVIYPELDKLLTSEWSGDHSSVRVSINL